jgi:hypothetical protein
MRPQKRILGPTSTAEYDYLNPDAPYPMWSDKYFEFIAREKRLWEGLEGYTQYEDFFEDMKYLQEINHPDKKFCMTKKQIEGFLAKEKLAWKTLLDPKLSTSLKARISQYVCSKEGQMCIDSLQPKQSSRPNTKERTILHRNRS